VTSAFLENNPSVLSLKGVGPRIAEKLSGIGIDTVQDVLFHFPYRYEDRTRVLAIGALRPGSAAIIECVIDYSQIAFSKKGKRRRMLVCHVSDGTGSLLLRFFYFNKQQESRLAKGVRIRCFGEVRYGASSYEMVHPEIKVINGNDCELEKSLTPVYPSSEGINQGLLRTISEQVLQSLDDDKLKELLPDKIIKKYNMPLLSDAIKTMHRPEPGIDLERLFEGQHPVKQRLAFEELLVQHISLLLMRKDINQCKSLLLNSDDRFINDFYKQLPYSLTNAQNRVIEEILEDVLSPGAMMRLIQGDVGSGKTVVAAVACLKAIESGYQSVLMAPTEILAEQHYHSFSEWFEPLGIQLILLTGKAKAKERKIKIEGIRSGKVNMVIGTHALFQSDVIFNKLAMIIIDEQHRFGVHQRLSLRNKGYDKGVYPHQLIMTATPIPRSLAMTAYADLDYSVIDELPPGRKKVKTSVMSASKRAEIIERVKQSSGHGSQVYWVCTLIEESETLQCQAAEDTLIELQNALPELRIDLVHGRLNLSDKQSVMDKFKNGEIDLLVATTVIEVGVDVPNATLMVIENAERLGLAQLHQLRGRVGRGSSESHCLLMYKSPLSENAKQRLSIMREFSSGFDVAMKDLELRGPGEVLGTRQTGDMEFRVADIIRDEYLLNDVKETAVDILNNYSDRVPLLINRWLGRSDRYGQIG